jgi:hypothetical protein
MTLQEETAIVAFAAESGFLPAGEIRDWAFGIIEKSPKPPLWVVELATLQSQKVEDLLAMFPPERKPSAQVRLQIIISGYFAGRLSLLDTLAKTFCAAILDEDAIKRGNEPLVDALIWWDQQDNLDEIGTALAARFHEIFQAYSQEASDVLRVLPQLKAVRPLRNGRERSENAIGFAACRLRSQA